MCHLHNGRIWKREQQHVTLTMVYLKMEWTRLGMTSAWPNPIRLTALFLQENGYPLQKISSIQSFFFFFFFSPLGPIRLLSFLYVKWFIYQLQWHYCSIPLWKRIQERYALPRESKKIWSTSIWYFGLNYFTLQYSIKSSFLTITCTSIVPYLVIPEDVNISKLFINIKFSKK